MDALPASKRRATRVLARGDYQTPGDAVTADEPIVELETDKVTIEAKSPAAWYSEGLALGRNGEKKWPEAIALADDPANKGKFDASIFIPYAEWLALNDQFDAALVRTFIT